MNAYIELSVENIELDKSNPRIARGVAYYGEDITSETMALLLGSTSEACASLRESIRENGGIIHPIVVNKRADGSYVVIEGNTRLQIYKDFIKHRVILSCIFIGSKWASLIAPQVLFALFTGVYSLYIYLVTKMDDHPGFLSLYKDKGYQDEENERVSDMIDGAQRAKNFLSAEGRNIEL